MAGLPKTQNQGCRSLHLAARFPDPAFPNPCCIEIKRAAKPAQLAATACLPAPISESPVRNSPCNSLTEGASDCRAQIVLRGNSSAHEGPIRSLAGERLTCPPVGLAAACGPGALSFGQGSDAGAQGRVADQLVRPTCWARVTPSRDEPKDRSCQPQRRKAGGAGAAPKRAGPSARALPSVSSPLSAAKSR